MQYISCMQYIYVNSFLFCALMTVRAIARALLSARFCPARLCRASIILYFLAYGVSMNVLNIQNIKLDFCLPDHTCGSLDPFLFLLSFFPLSY